MLVTDPVISVSSLFIFVRNFSRRLVPYYPQTGSKNLLIKISGVKIKAFIFGADRLRQILPSFVPEPTNTHFSQTTSVTLTVSWWVRFFVHVTCSPLRAPEPTVPDYVHSGGRACLISSLVLSFVPEPTFPYFSQTTPLTHCVLMTLIGNKAD